MNSVIQSLVSMPRLVRYIEERVLSYCIDAPDGSTAVLPVTEALYDLCSVLNDANPTRNVLRPSGLVNALAGNKGNQHLLGYQQQDAHELFQFVSSLVTKEETPLMPPPILSFADIHRLAPQHPASAAVSASSSSAASNTDIIPASPLRHDTFDNLSLTVPSTVSVTVNLFPAT
eukprot:jgi/Hompol1/6908/HPOL_002392-RA